MDSSASDISTLRHELHRSRWLATEPSGVREEIVQDAVAEVMTRFAGRPAADQTRIGHAIVRYMVWARRRKNARDHAVPITPETAVETTAGPSDQAEHEELRRELYRAILDTLSPDERRVIYLRFFEGLTAADAAHEMKLPLQRVYYLSRVAIGNLQRALGAFSGLGGD